jgi:hypothetical protein
MDLDDSAFYNALRSEYRSLLSQSEGLLMRCLTALGRHLSLLFACSSVLLPLSTAWAAPLEGHYLEARTCQVYTGPCFANGEMGMAGKDAVLAWSIQQGDQDGVDLSGLHVALVVRASNTLGHQGFDNARLIRSMIIVDQAADALQREALVRFVRSQAAAATVDIAAIQSAPIRMNLDITDLTGQLQVGDLITLNTRKARPGDCICSNETAFYPPLTKLDGFVPGVTIDGEVTARTLGTRWSIPDTRTAYLGTFSVSLE